MRVELTLEKRDNKISTLLISVFSGWNSPSNMEESYDDEPKRWRSSRKLPFKQISFGLKQIVKDGVPNHLQELHEALKLTTCLPSSGDVSWDNEVSLCRSRIQQALSMLMQDLHSLEDMRAIVRDEEMTKFKELASPCCQEVDGAIRGAKQVIASLEQRGDDSTVRQVSKVSPSTSSGFEDVDESEQDQELMVEQQHLLIDNEILEERSSGLESLANNMADLQEMMFCLNQHVVQDGEKVHAIDTHVKNAALEISVGEKLLRQARHYKTAALPAVGATVGFIAGGPIGAIAGVRVGIAVSLVGSAAGYVGGKLIHNANSFMPPRFRPRMPTAEPLVESGKPHAP